MHSWVSSPPSASSGTVDSGGPWEDPGEGDTSGLWEDPGQGHWRAVGGPGEGDTGGPWEDPGMVPCRPWCRCGPGCMGAILRSQVWVRPEPLRLKRPGEGAVLDPDHVASTTAPAALTHTRDHTGTQGSMVFHTSLFKT